MRLEAYKETSKFGELRKKRRTLAACLSGAVIVMLTLCAIVSMPPKANALSGLASWYDLSGNMTASGDTLAPDSWTAAHRTFAFGSELTVCYGDTCVHNVVVNDRGPYAGGRDLDLHVAPAAELGLTYTGVDYVRYRREIVGHWDGVYVTPAGSGKWVNY
jgi:rare lipoprotein A (peptidoglycan hydrolase)